MPEGIPICFNYFGKPLERKAFDACLWPARQLFCGREFTAIPVIHKHDGVFENSLRFQEVEASRGWLEIAVAIILFIPATLCALLLYYPATRPNEEHQYVLGKFPQSKPNSLPAVAFHGDNLSLKQFTLHTGPNTQLIVAGAAYEINKIEEPSSVFVVTKIHGVCDFFGPEGNNPRNTKNFFMESDEHIKTAVYHHRSAPQITKHSPKKAQNISDVHQILQNLLTEQFKKINTLSIEFWNV